MTKNDETYGSHDPSIVDSDKEDLFNTFLFEFVQMLQISGQMLTAASLGKGSLYRRRLEMKI